MKIDLNRLENALVVLALVSVLLVTGCGKKTEIESFDGLNCGALDQHRSYLNPIDSTKMQTISVDSQFSAAEIAKIENAVETWNSQARRSTGANLFRVQTLTLSANTIPTSTDTCGFPGDSSAFSIMKVTNAQTWSSLGLKTANPGVTMRCSYGKEFTSKQVILLNTDNMKRSPQVFENVILHELGHSIGLDHSCMKDSTGKPGYAGCKSLTSGHDYLDAVMDPDVSPSHVKEFLNSNDEERATCALNYRP